jgi:hypothetical protein
MIDLLHARAADDAKQLAALRPTLFLDASIDRYLKAPISSAYQLWRQLDNPSPDLLRCIWNATGPSLRPSGLSLFRSALSDQQYGAAESALAVFGCLSERDGFVDFNCQDSTGFTLYGGMRERFVGWLLTASLSLAQTNGLSAPSL